jgi:multidrug efflux system outer membrane protein
VIAKLSPAVALLVSACMVGPDYRRPTLAVPSRLVQTSSGAIHVSDDPPWDRWWTMFGDPALDLLIEQAEKENQDLRAAIAHVEVSRALVQEAFAPLFPSLDADGSYTYGKASKNANALASGNPSSLFQITAEAGYELDFWGHNRRGLEAARSEEIASEDDRRTVRVSVITDTVQAYFDLGELEAAREIAREALEVRQKTLDLVRVRYEAGIAHELDLRRAESELKSAEADLFESERIREVAMHRLALLVGALPEVAFKGRAPRSFALPPEVPIGIPSTLLLRRPDVHAAEMRLRAANARIGVAEADFFPRVTLLGTLGYASLDAKTLAQSGAQLWSLGPSIHLPIFQGGALHARWEQMKARTDEASASYRQVVLRAFSEVADSLSSVHGHQAQRGALELQVSASARAVELAETGYRQGISTYLDVLDAQRTLLGARQALLRAERNVLGDLVALEKALGGGWDEADREQES